jgi:hypothetical protein
VSQRQVADIHIVMRKLELVSQLHNVGDGAQEISVAQHHSL